MNYFATVKRKSSPAIQEILATCQDFLEYSQEELPVCTFNGSCYLSDSLYSRLKASATYSNMTYMHWNESSQSSFIQLFFEEFDLNGTNFYKVLHIQNGCMRYVFKESEDAALIFLTKEELVLN